MSRATRQHLHPAERNASYVLGRATSEIVIGTKFGIDSTHKLASEGFKRLWPLIIMNEAVRRNTDALFKTNA